jgi:hypothetical protein
VVRTLEFSFSFKNCFLRGRICGCRPQDRTAKDVEAITAKMRAVDVLARLPSHVLQQLAACVYYEDLEKGVTRE